MSAAFSISNILGMILFGFVFLFVVVTRLRTWRRRRDFLDSVSEHMSDETFLANMDIPPELHAICLAMRRAMADNLDLPSGILRPSDSFVQLYRLGFTDADFCLCLSQTFALASDEAKAALRHIVLEICLDNTVQDPATFEELIRLFLDNPSFVRAAEVCSGVVDHGLSEST